MSKLKTYGRVAGLLLGALLVGPTLAQAEETAHAAYRETGVVKDWIGIHAPARGGQSDLATCAIYARPQGSTVTRDGKPVEIMRGELAAFLAWADGKADSETGEISFLMGVELDESPEVAPELIIDDKVKFPMIAVGDRLYLEPESDKTAIAALRKGHVMKVTATARDGETLADTYSLMGVQGVTALQTKECQ